MIRIDRSSTTSVLEQLREQLRYALATGAYPIGTYMPSTRTLADQLQISFHTVRKAYQELAGDGLLEAIRGGGFLVRERVPPNAEERMEQGAAVVYETLQRLVGLGLDESEIEYLLDEQFSALDHARERHRIVFVAPFLEMAEACADALARLLQTPVDAVPLRKIENEQDADYVVTTHALIRDAMDRLPRSDVLSATTFLTPEAMDQVARLRNHETLGIVAYYSETMPYLMRAIQMETGFEGQMLGASIEQGARHVTQLAGQLNLLVYTPKSRRRLLQLMQEVGHPMAPIAWHIARDSLDAIRSLVPA